MRGQTPLPTRARDALAVLESTTKADRTGLSHAQACQRLQDAGFECTDVSDRIEILLLRGYLYEVDERLFIT